ncbi:MAG: ABC transporter permease subunit [Vicinamibacteria bacterium]|jgi:phosphate transport system permease protein|nr:ABC transporter permease subunit [Vicinamibacteria bacterium]
MNSEITISDRIASASRRIARLRRVDRAATVVIVLGGLAVVICVVGILFFIVAETLPLFTAGHGERTGVVDLAGENSALTVGVDEYQRYVYVVRRDGTLTFHRLADGSLARRIPLGDLGGAQITAASRTPQGDWIAAATSDGRVVLTQIRFSPRYESARLIEVDFDIQSSSLIVADKNRRPIRVVACRESEGSPMVAALVTDDEIVSWRKDDSGSEQRNTLRGVRGEIFTSLALSRSDALVAGTDKGRVFHWELTETQRLTDIVKASDAPLSSVAWILGDGSFIVADRRGGLSGWFRVRLHEDDEQPTMVRAHVFEPHGSAVTALAISSRNKSFASLGADGSLAVHYFTNERRLLDVPGDGHDIVSALVTPKGDGLLALRADGRLARFTVHSPYPEVSWRALFGKLWYEGYPQPAAVWQSTGATNDFEAKLSLVPLMFGTLKATFYALLFAIPLGVMGALYTSQFMQAGLKAKIKPTVEIMAALPSVVIGFIAGLWLSGWVERHLVAVLTMMVLLPLFGTGGFAIWAVLPRKLRLRIRAGSELVLILPLLLLAGWAALHIAPFIEAYLFGSDLRLWLATTLGLTYDQRNSLVVGIAMGFAVIPIIFTISEDAFSSVPANLTAASLAMGASRWQTAWRVVLPTASPGIFSAVMVGLGRAVGETMIVLMATGNTPVLDWSIFNGMRTLSANIAVEIPEAPYGGTLYRVLFLSGGVLFVMTFLANTIAEAIRQRLRQRYRAL